MHHPGEPGNNGNDIYIFLYNVLIFGERKKKEKKKETRRKSGRSVVSSKDKIFASA